MGLLPLSNHLALIRDCYPPASSSSSGSTSLPSPQSNPLGKLTFYAVHRPQKTPKVLAALVDRARSARSSASPGPTPSKARTDLGVTVEIVRAVVVEWGESDRDDTAGVLKNAVAEGALRVAELALGGGGDSPGYVRQQKRDPEMEARGASLFHAVATYLSPPFFATSLEEGRGDDTGMGRTYLRCLSLVSALAQVSGGAAEAQSRSIALKALEGAVKSEFLVAAASVQDYDKQVEEIVPALAANIVEADLAELRLQLDKAFSSDSALKPLPRKLSSRKSASISSPSDPPSPTDLTSLALPSFLLLSRLSPSPQALSSFLGALCTFLDRFSPASSSPSPSSTSSGTLWRAPAQPLVLFLARDCVLRAAPVALQPAASSWWIDRVGEIYDSGAEHKSVTLLYVLKHLLEPSPALGTAGGVSKPTALHTLLELLVRRARFRPRGVNSPGQSPNPSMGNLLGAVSARPSLDDGAAEEEDDEESEEDAADPLLAPLFATLGALARAASHPEQGAGGYSTELDDLAAELIGVLRALFGLSSPPVGGAGVGAGSERAARVLRGMSEEEQSKARRRAVRALRVWVEDAALPAGSDLQEGGTKGGVEDDGVRRPRRDLGASEMTIRPEGRRAEENETAAGGLAGGVPGLTLGAAVNGNGSLGATVPTTFVMPASPTSSPAPSPARPAPSANSPSVDGTSSRDPISPSTFLPTLFLLTHPDPLIRLEYGKTLRAYLAREVPAFSSSSSGSSVSAAEQARFYRLVHGAVYALASGEIRAPSSGYASSAAGGASGFGSSFLSPSSPLTAASSLPTSPSIPLDAAPSPSASLPSAADYALLASLLSPSSRSAYPSASFYSAATAVLEGLPALLAFADQAATNWEVGLAGPGEGAKHEVRARACREVAVRGVEWVWKAGWGGRELGEAVEEALTALSPHIIPSNLSLTSTFPSLPLGSPSVSSPLNASLIVDILAADANLQRATGLDRAELRETLGRRWEAEKVRGEAEVPTSPTRSPYLSSTLPSRSFVNLTLSGSSHGHSASSPGTNGGESSLLNFSPSRGGSTVRLPSANPSLAPSSRHASLAFSLGAGSTHTGGAGSSLLAPSLADLQLSLGGGGGSGATSGQRSARTSAAPSIASSAGGLGAEARSLAEGGRRRTSRARAEDVLGRVGQGRARTRSSAAHVGGKQTML
ncbi:hypothetical protein JCM8097_006442 [Rhodosporidiobolus ruineniae]